MKPLWIALPIIVLALVVLVRALIGRRISRHTLNVVVALYLLAYLLTAASLGLFWVARMDLPAFDLHYLFGYCVLLLAAWHLWFQLPIVSAFFRRISPRVLVEADGRRWRRGVRVTVWAVLAAMVGAAATWIIIEFLRPKPIIILPMITKWNPHPERIWIQQGRKKIAAADYIHRESSLTRWGVLRLLRFWGERPDEFKSFPDKEWTELPRPRLRSDVSLQVALAGVRKAPAEKMSLQQLSDLLFHAYGVTELRRYPTDVLHLRAAASAGALYPTDLYVVANAVEGLAKGLYYYHAARHSLARLADEEVIERVGRATALSEQVRAAPVSIIFTVVFDRTVWKYNIRSYRYVAMDAGHVAGNLALAASALGWSCRFTGRFDDEQLTSVVQADPQHEGSLLVALLGAAPGREPLTVPAFAPPPMPKEPSKMEVTRLAHSLTSWRWIEGEPRRVSAPKRPAQPKVKPEWIKLPGGSVGHADLYEVIRARRSFREFPDSAVSLENVAGLLRDSWSAAGKVDGGEFLRLHVLARNVEGLAAGVYRYWPEAGDSGALESVAEGDFGYRIYSAGLSQELLSLAAFVLVWTVDMERIGERDGERDYRHACLAAGFGGEAAYLGAVARGLGICGVGAYYDADVDKVLRLEGTQERSLYLMGVGPRQ